MIKHPTLIGRVKAGQYVASPVKYTFSVKKVDLFTLMQDLGFDSA
jgi:hypothetical protein